MSVIDHFTFQILWQSVKHFSFLGSFNKQTYTYTDLYGWPTWVKYEHLLMLKKSLNLGSKKNCSKFFFHDKMIATLL